MHSIPIRPHVRGPQIKKRVAKLAYTLVSEPSGDFPVGSPWGKNEVSPDVFAVGTKFKDRAGTMFVMTALGLVAE